MLLHTTKETHEWPQHFFFYVSKEDKVAKHSDLCVFYDSNLFWQATLKLWGLTILQ